MKNTIWAVCGWVLILGLVARAQVPPLPAASPTETAAGTSRSKAVTPYSLSQSGVLAGTDPTATSNLVYRISSTNNTSGNAATATLASGITGKIVETNNLSDAAYVALVGGGNGSVTITNNTDAVGIVTGSGDSYGIGTNQTGISGSGIAIQGGAGNVNTFTNPIVRGTLSIEKTGDNSSGWQFLSVGNDLWLTNTINQASFLFQSNGVVVANSLTLSQLTASNSIWTGAATMTNAGNNLAVASITNHAATASQFAAYDANKKLISTRDGSTLTNLSSYWISYPTNSGASVSPYMTNSYALLSTNAAFAALLPAGVDTTQTQVQTSVLLVTNTTASAVVITPPAAPVKSLGVWYVTNVSSITYTVYPKVVTNAICLPIF